MRVATRKRKEITMSPDHRPTQFIRRSGLAVALAVTAAAPTFAGCGTDVAPDDVQESTSALTIAATARRLPTTATTTSVPTTPLTGIVSVPINNLAAALPDPPPIYVGDANDLATVLADSDRFWATYFGDADEAAVEASIGAQITENGTPFWEFGQQTSALVQMYDLLAPLDKARAAKYLARLHSYADAFLANRDDVRGFPADAFRHRYMPAWGAYTHNRDDRWNTDVVIAGLFTYPMAAFSRRILGDQSLLADNPTLQAQYRSDAIRYVSAVFDTYDAYRPEMHLDDGDSEAYFTVPEGYAFLSCSNGAYGCSTYRDTAGAPLAYNENLSMMKALAEVALASNTALYRAAPDASPLRLYYGLYEAPLLIAKNYTFFADHLQSETLGDGTPYFIWNHQLPTSNLQDTAHAGFELGSLAVLLGDTYGLDSLLTGDGRSEQVPESAPLFVRFGNTFLRKIWHYDFQNPNPNAPGQNLLAKMVDGSGDASESSNDNVECAGWLPLTQYSPWVWTRCRDATFHGAGYLRVDNYAALLRYRQYR
jgi:hypothetical protein